MFKRSVVTLLMLLYLGTVSGFALNFHYCFNRLSSVEINAPSRLCVKEQASGRLKCCKNTHVDVKVKDAHQAGASLFLAKVFSFDVPKSTFTEFNILAQESSSEKIAGRGPPLPLTGITIFLKNCTFRI